MRHKAELKARQGWQAGIFSPSGHRMTHKAELQALLDASLAVAGSFDGVGSDGWMRGEVHSSEYEKFNECISKSMASLKKDEAKPIDSEIISKIAAKLEAEAAKSPKWSEHNLLMRLAKEIREGDY